VTSVTPRYILPFALLLAFLGLRSVWPLSPAIDYPARVLVVGGVLLFYSRPVIQLRPRAVLASLGIGAAVFVIWIGPDLLFPHYRQHWLFQNPVTGVSQTIPDTALHNPWLLFFRVVRAVVVVPIAEELFWRAWLMRWLISPDFESIPLGTYAAGAFWIVALLFASEHGPFWDVGLAAGIIYNWWMIRTKSLADCILAHAVTNGLLCAWVILTHSWQYWM
jgi:CAAX prenyl protease-like protein